MKTTTWLCPVLTLLCAAELVYTAQRGSYDIYPWDNVNAQMLQSDDYFLAKRNKPSLSIVNPLDVLRKRLLLEIARRQMKENSRQVELNRAILKNVGKRMASKYSTPLAAPSYDGQRDIQQQQQHDLPPHTQLYDYELIPTTLIFDYLQQRQQQKQRLPWLLPYEATAAQFDNNYPNDFNVDAASEDDADYGVANAVQDIIKFNGIVANNDKHFWQNMKQSNDGHANSPNMPPEPVTTFQKSINGNINSDSDSEGFKRSNSNKNDETKRFTLINNRQHHRNDKNDFNFDPNDANLVSAKANQNVYKNDLRDSGDVYQVQRYLYHLHKNQNHLTRK